MSANHSRRSLSFLVVVPAVFLIGLGGAYAYRTLRQPQAEPSPSLPSSASGGQPIKGPFWVPERLTPLMAIMTGKDQDRASRAALTRKAVRKFLDKSLAPCLAQLPPSTLELQTDLSVGSGAITLTNLHLAQVARGGPVSTKVAACLSAAMAGKKIVPLNPLRKYLQGYAGSETVYLDVRASCE